MSKRSGFLAWIFGYSKKHIWQVVFMTLISAMISLIFIVLAVMSKQVIDIATAEKTGNILYYLILFSVLIAFQAGLNILNSNIRVRASGKIEMNIKKGVFNSLFKKELTELNKYHSGEFINRLTSDIGIVVDGIISIIPDAVSMAVKLIAGIIVLIIIAPFYTLILIACGMVVFLISWLYRKKFKSLHKEVQQTDGKTRSFMQECIENFIVIKSFSSGKPVMARLKDLQIANFKAKIKRNTISNLANTGVYVLFSSSYYFTLIWGVIQVGTGSMSFGSLIAFLQVFEQVKTPFKNISGIIPQYLSMVASVERLMEIEKMKDEAINADVSDVEGIYDKMESINFENISFKYNEEPIFENATIHIKKGELIAITGNSGVGKSTLFKLLLGLISVNNGIIYLKTKDKNFNINAGTRKMFSYVPQGNMILSGTIRENITFFNDEVSELEAINSAKTACIMDFVQDLPDGLDTFIGERGVGLSEGQIQRIAIARALTSKAPILLLDEATSALDSITEGKLLRNLKKIKNKTCIFISHRESTIADCDRVLSIENNKVYGG